MTRVFLLAVLALLVTFPFQESTADVFRSRLIVRERAVDHCHVRRNFVEQVVVERVVDNYPDYRYYVGQDVRDDAIAEKAALKLLRTQYQIELQAIRTGNVEELRKLFPGLFPGRGQPEPGQAGNNSKPVPPQGPPTTEPPLEKPVPPTDATPTVEPVSKVFQTHCVKCHKPGKTEGGLDLTDPTKLTELQRWKVFGLSVSGTMPKGGNPISDKEAQAIMDWVQGK